MHSHLPDQGRDNLEKDRLCKFTRLLLTVGLNRHFLFKCPPQISQTQYREGIEGYQRVLDTLRFQSEQEDSLSNIKGAVAINLIAIYKALGGGWEIRKGREFIPEKTKEVMRYRTDWGELLDSGNAGKSNSE